METPPANTPGNEKPRDATYWAEQTSVFKVTQLRSGALNLNVEGRHGLSPLQGFGQMWQKIYRVRLKGVTASPIEVIKVWKENFETFWPKGNRFHAPLTGIAPGEVAILRIIPGGMPLSTGVMVLYADDESFTLMTPQGHVFAGWITFSAYVDTEGDSTIAQVELLIRANDPIYEIGLRFGGHKTENKFWEHTLLALAAHFNAQAAVVETRVTCLDPKMQWSEFKNIWQNAAMRTMLYTLTAPLRRVRKRGKKGQKIRS